MDFVDSLQCINSTFHLEIDSPEVQLPVPDWVDVLTRPLDNVRRQFDHPPRALFSLTLQFGFINLKFPRYLDLSAL